MIRQVYKFAKLPDAQRYLVVYAALLLVVIKLGLGLRSFQRVQRLLARLSLYKPSWLKQFSIAQGVWAVKIASHHVPSGAKCLARALTTKTLLSQSGHESELRIGAARNQNGDLEAHAWVEHDGQVIIGELSDLDRFVPLSSLKIKSV